MIVTRSLNILTWNSLHQPNTQGFLSYLKNRKTYLIAHSGKNIICVLHLSDLNVRTESTIEIAPSDLYTADDVHPQ